MNKNTNLLAADLRLNGPSIREKNNGNCLNRRRDPALWLWVVKVSVQNIAGEPVNTW